MNTISGITKSDGSGIKIVFENHYDLDRRCRSPINTYVNNCKVTNFVGDSVDGFHLEGTGSAYVERLYVSRHGQQPDLADESASIVNGVDVIFVDCVFTDNGKGFLQGSGDTNLLDLCKGQRSLFYHCYFKNNSRRCPYINAGQCYILNCVVENWGISSTFHEKSFGIRAGKYAQVTVANTAFFQEDLRTCLRRGTFLKDTFGQYFLPFIGPGFRRAAFADMGGSIQCTNCYTNRNWLYLENHYGPTMPEEEALRLREELRTLELELKR